MAEEVLKVIKEMEPRYSELGKMYLRHFASRVKYAEEEAKRCNYWGTMLQLVYAGMALGEISKELTLSDFTKLMRAVERVADTLRACEKLVERKPVV